MKGITMAGDAGMVSGITRRDFVAGAGATLAACALCGAPDSRALAEGVAFTAGTYTASAAGRNGDVTVAVTFDDDSITDISTEHEETATIGGAAIDTLTEEVIA
jgi:hypothetical protein